MRKTACTLMLLVGFPAFAFAQSAQQPAAVPVQVVIPNAFEWYLVFLPLFYPIRQYLVLQI